jgi:MoxR-like ATPase
MKEQFPQPDPGPQSKMAQQSPMVGVQENLTQINLLEKLSGVVFEKLIKKDGQTEYRSSASGRKIIILDKNPKFEPEEGKSYEVEIISDSNPNNPEKGKYIAQIVAEETEIDVGEDYNEEYDFYGVPLKEDKENLGNPLPIEVDGVRKKVFVLETELPLNEQGGQMVPRAELFNHFTLDKRTVETIEKIATAVELRNPCLLEGETSTSKTSSIEYLGSRTNNEVVRLNLNGQTDTSELIGKFIPNDGQLQVEFEEALRHPELLSDQSREILIRANAEGRALSLIESQKIAEVEKIKIPDWRWQDGIIPHAMKVGQWVILDELNLAEPQILERLNSCLERSPAVTLSENGGVKIGPGGKYETHPNFRIFGTMNPAEYAGRAPMSPAYKDRWTSYKFVEEPRQEDYEAMMELMIFGKQPEVEVRGKKYKGEETSPLFETLGQIRNVRQFTAKLAKFHTTVENLARKREIGKDRKEKYIFTRRGLIELMGYLENKSIVERQTGKKSTILDNPKGIILRALQYYYLDKLSNPDDVKKVQDQLDAIGISESKWTLDLERARPPKKERMTPSREVREIEIFLRGLDEKIEDIE